jgi:hypothetical protein
VLLRVSAVTSLPELDPAIGGPATEQARQSACRVQSIFLDTSRSATAGHVFHSWLEPRRAEATVSASARGTSYSGTGRTVPRQSQCH